jgi:LysM repeat protein
MARLIQTIPVLLLLISPAFGQAVYLKFDQECMDRFEYTSSDNSSPYISYAFQLGDRKVALMDIGSEDGKPVKDLPGKVIYCKDITIDKALIQKINSGTTKFYIVRENATNYLVSSVDKAVFIEQYRNAVDFTAEDAEFVLYTDNLVSEVNLAKPTSKMEVYLHGTLRTQCVIGYILKKKDNYRSERYKELVLVPEIGIVEKSSVSGSGFFADADKGVTFKLNRVNDKPYKEMLTTVCDRLQADFYDNKNKKPSEYEDLVSKSDTPKEYGNAPAGQGTHTVQKGETLYSISKRYGITLDQLRTWNGLQGSDVISIGQQLKVSSSSTASTTTGSSGSTSGSTGTTTAKGEGYWISTSELHTVKSGETIGEIATLYGYTEARFRKMNGLSPNERIYVGQKLRTSDCVCPTLESTTKDKPLPYEAETEKLTSKGNPDVYYRPIKIHEVKKNETLFSIAKLYDTTTDRILELNGLKSSDAIKPSQKLYVQ